MRPVGPYSLIVSVCEDISFASSYILHRTYIRASSYSDSAGVRELKTKSDEQSVFRQKTSRREETK